VFHLWDGAKKSVIIIPCPQKGGKFYPILLHKCITHRTGKIYLLFPDGLYDSWILVNDNFNESPWHEYFKYATLYWGNNFYR